jgi:hypothetical protein
MTTIAALWLTSTAAAQDNKVMSEQAKVVAEKFVKALLVDLKADDAMEFVAVPYFHMGPNPKVKGQEDGKPTVLKKLDAVKQEIAVFVKNRNGEKLTGKLSSHENTYDAFPRSDSKQTRKALDEVMKKTDRVVTVRLATDDEKSVGGYADLTVLVSWRNGQPKVAGYVGGINQGTAHLGRCQGRREDSRQGQETGTSGQGQEWRGGCRQRRRESAQGM